MDNEDEFVRLPPVRRRESVDQSLTHLPPLVKHAEAAQADEAPVKLPVVKSQPAFEPPVVHERKEGVDAPPAGSALPEHEVVSAEPPLVSPAPAPAETLQAAVKLPVRKRMQPSGGDSPLPVMVKAPLREEPTEEAEWGRAAAPGSSRKSGWLVVCLVALAGGGGWLWLDHSKQKDPLQTTPLAEQIQTSSPQAKPQQDVAEEENARRLLARMEAQVRAYLTAPDPTQLLKYVRFPEHVAPLMPGHYERHPYEPRGFQALGAVECIAQNDESNFWRVRTIVGGIEADALLVEQSKQSGEIRVDWENDVDYQPMEWDEFATKRPSGHYDFRVDLKLGSLYSHEFADEKSVICFTLAGKGGEELMYGYMNRNSQAAGMLSEALRRKNDQPVRVMVRLHVPEGLKSPRGVVIEELVSTNWWYIKPGGK